MRSTGIAYWEGMIDVAGTSAAVPSRDRDISR